jgi:NADP-reducing hydrogenase subunit HndC
MQILKPTNLKAIKKAIKIGPKKVLELIKPLTGRGGAGFPTAKKWEFAIKTKEKVRYVICNSDEGEPGTFKDKFIIENNPETLIEGILIAAFTIKAQKAFIYLRGEYEYLKSNLENAIHKINPPIEIEIVVGAGAYVCGDETAIIKSIEGFRGHPYYKPPFPPVEGLFGKPTVINNVETLTNVAQAVLFHDWNSNLRLYSLSGNVTKPGVYELPVGTSLKTLIELGKPKNKVKAVYFGCFGGCMPYKNIELTPKNVCGKNCAIGSFTIIVVDEKQSIPKLAENIAEFYERESCGKCTPCREGTKRILDILRKINNGKGKKDDVETLEDLSKHIHETALCGLGKTATNHVLNACLFFKKEFK